MSYYNVGIFADDKYYNAQGTGIGFANDINMIARKLSHNKKYNLAIDASTTCTGFCLLREDYAVQFVFDYARKDTEKEAFFLELESILKHLVWGLDMNIVLIEQPILQAKNKHTRGVLLTLCKRLKNFMKDIPELYNVKPVDVRPNSWKSFMYNSEKYKGGYNDKATIARCICDRYPVYRAHYKNVTSTDYDCFDAVGIMRYYLDSIQNQIGESVNFSSAEYTHQSLVWAKFCKDDTIPKIVFSRQEDAPVVVRKWNDEYNFYKNIKMASTGKEIVLMEVPTDFLKVLISLEANIKIEQDKKLYIAVCRKSLVKHHKTFLKYVEDSGYSSFTVY